MVSILSMMSTVVHRVHDVHGVHSVHMILLRDDKTNCDNEPDNGQQNNRADDLIAREVHGEIPGPID